MDTFHLCKDQIINNIKVQKEFDDRICIINEAQFDPPTLEDIKKAISGRYYVGIYYEEEIGSDVKSGFRLIEPLVLGKGYMGQNPNQYYLRAYVIKDSRKDKSIKIKRKSVSKSGRNPFYRIFRMDRIKQWFRFNYKFSKYRELYNPDDLLMDNIVAALQFSDFPRGLKK